MSPNRGDKGKFEFVTELPNFDWAEEMLLQSSEADFSFELLELELLFEFRPECVAKTGDRKRPKCGDDDDEFRVMGVAQTGDSNPNFTVLLSCEVLCEVLCEVAIGLVIELGLAKVRNFVDCWQSVSTMAPVGEKS